MTETEKLKAQIKVLEKKLSFLEELEQTRSPMEEAYNEWYGEYPPTSPDADRRDIARWHGFQAGYHAVHEEKVVKQKDLAIAVARAILEAYGVG
jgi:hypothetical protein